MDLTILGLSSYELFLSVFFGLISIFVATKFVEIVVLKEKISTYIHQKNMAVAIFLGSVTVAIQLVVSGSILPAVNSLQATISVVSDVTFMLIIKSFLQFLLFYIISLVVSLAVIGMSLLAYMVATRNVDEIKEIKLGNTMMAVILGMTIVSLAMFVRPATKNFLGSLVNYEQTSRELTK